MAHAVLDPPPSAPRPEKPGAGYWIRFGLRGLGQTLITLGVIVGLFIVYEVWITNIWADANNDRHISHLRHEYDTVSGLPSGGSSSVPIGSAIGILYIPRFGQDYTEAIVQGDTVPNDDQLDQGTAHYGKTAMPGQTGNFAVAGHRVGNGNPFLNLDQLESGDKLIVETQSTWYVYQVLGGPAGGNPQTDTPATIDYQGGSVQLQARQIIEPSDGRVLAPIPNHPEIPQSSAVDKLMTMTTCDPKFTASHRMIVYSELIDSIPALGNTPTSKASDMPPQITALYNEVNG